MIQKESTPHKTFKNRSDNSVPTNLTLTREAHTKLQREAPGRRSYGEYVSKLIVNDHEKDRFANLEQEQRAIRHSIEQLRKDLKGLTKKYGRME